MFHTFFQESSTFSICDYTILLNQKDSTLTHPLFWNFSNCYTITFFKKQQQQTSNISKPILKTYCSKIIYSVPQHTFFQKLSTFSKSIFPKPSTHSNSSPSIKIYCSKIDDSISTTSIYKTIKSSPTMSRGSIPLPILRTILGVQAP